MPCGSDSRPRAARIAATRTSASSELSAWRTGSTARGSGMDSSASSSGGLDGGDRGGGEVFENLPDRARADDGQPRDGGLAPHGVVALEVADQAADFKTGRGPDCHGYESRGVLRPKIHAITMLIAYRTIIGAAIRDWVTTSLLGVMTAAMMKMMRMAYFVWRAEEAGRHHAHARQRQHQRRHLEDDPEGQQHAGVEAEGGRHLRHELQVVGC